MGKKWTIGIFQPNDVLLQGFEHILSGSNFDIAFKFRDFSEVAQTDARPADVDLVLADFSSRNTFQGSEIELLRDRFPKAKIVFFTDKAMCGSLMRVAGSIDGMVLDSLRSDILLKMLEITAMGERIFPDAVMCAAAAPRRSESGFDEAEGRSSAPTSSPRSMLGKLSAREVEVVDLLCEGRPNKIIGRRLGIAEATVKAHVKAILRKLEVKNRTEAALILQPYRSQGGALGAPGDLFRPELTEMGVQP